MDLNWMTGEAIGDRDRISYALADSYYGVGSAALLALNDGDRCALYISGEEDEMIRAAVQLLAELARTHSLEAAEVLRRVLDGAERALEAGDDEG